MTELPGRPPGWGVLPVLFRLGPVPVPAYEVFVSLGLFAGLALLLWLSRREERRGDLVAVTLAALAGGAVGAKLLEWAFSPGSFPRQVSDGLALLGGRTILGGLLGGTLAVALVKRHLGIRVRRGNTLAAPIALGLALGRLGCFLNGCCHGVPTDRPWGVDFGDGVFRHPTQLYEVAFATLALPVLLWLRPRVATPGRLLSGFLAAYFAFRFAEEFWRAGPRPLLGLTLYQAAALAGLAYYVWRERPGPVLRPGGA